MADWADATDRLGDDATTADLVRTPAQRAADALYAIFTRASGPRTAPNRIIVDVETFERTLTAADERPPRHLDPPPTRRHPRPLLIEHVFV